MNSSLYLKKGYLDPKNAIDSVTATELLKALQTLENIHLIQEESNEDFNISFCQKDSF